MSNPVAGWLSRGATRRATTWWVQTQFLTQRQLFGKRNYASADPNKIEYDLYRLARPKIIRPVLFTTGVIVSSVGVAHYCVLHKASLDAKWTDWKKQYLAPVFGSWVSQQPAKAAQSPPKYPQHPVGFWEDSLRGLKQRLQELSPGKKAILGITSINALVFLLWQIPVPGVRNFMMRNFLHSAYSGRTYTLLTSAFSHSTLWHFLFNTMAMWGFGDATHHLLGREYFLAFTASSAVTSSLSMHLWHAITRNAVPGLGSSGFVFSYVALTAMCYPTSKMQLFFAIPVPLLEGLYGLCIFDIIGLTGLWGKLFNLSLGHSAHLGGVGVGVGLYWLLVNKRRVRSFFPPELGRLYDRYYQTVFAPPTRWR